MPLEAIKGPLDEFLKDIGLAVRVKGWQALPLWGEVVGPGAAARSRAIAFDGGRLIVEVDGPAWASQLSYLRRTIRDSLNERLGERVIQEIQFTPARGAQG
jgi:predicted nucleic acid-binding Zn ribbon protein